MLDAWAPAARHEPTRCSSTDKEFSEMLVLSRKVGERIHVGDNIVLEIRRIAGNRVTLALDAPREVRILRGELERVAKEFKPPVQQAVNGGSAAPAPLPLLNNLAAGATSPDCTI
jgi:carbon storage regulator CsrA